LATVSHSQKLREALAKQQAEAEKEKK